MSLDTSHSYLYDKDVEAAVDAISESLLSPKVKIIAKGSQSAIIRGRRASALKRIKEIENELGRMSRLLSELRSDLTTE